MLAPMDPQVGPDQRTWERIHETIANSRAALAAARHALARSRALVAALDRRLTRDAVRDGAALRRRVATLAAEEARLTAAIRACAARGDAEGEDRLRNRAQVVRGQLERLRREAGGERTPPR